MRTSHVVAVLAVLHQGENDCFSGAKAISGRAGTSAIGKTFSQLGVALHVLGESVRRVSSSATSLHQQCRDAGKDRHHACHAVSRDARQRGARLIHSGSVSMASSVCTVMA
jgi:hypothetical protein